MIEYLRRKVRRSRVRMKKTATERFNDSWVKDPLTGCYNWQKYISPKGYASIRDRGKKFLAHRWIWIQYYGNIPPEYEINHLCNNRKCVNIIHLEVCTHGKNIAYSAVLGTHNKGEKIGTAKLTADRVRSIRVEAWAGVPQKLIAKLFGLSLSQTNKIITKKHWAHV